MTGDRGLAFVVIGLMGISLGSIIQARMPRKNAMTGVVTLPATVSESVLKDPVSSGIYLEAELKSLTRRKGYMPDGRSQTLLGKRRKLLWNTFDTENFPANSAIDAAVDDIDTSHLFDFAKPVE